MKHLVSLRCVIRDISGSLLAMLSAFLPEKDVWNSRSTTMFH